jgi:hypothetical protein
LTDKTLSQAYDGYKVDNGCFEGRHSSLGMLFARSHGWLWVWSYNRSIARAIQTEDEKALVSAIQALEG